MTTKEQHTEARERVKASLESGELTYAGAKELRDFFNTQVRPKFTRVWEETVTTAMAEKSTDALFEFHAVGATLLVNQLAQHVALGVLLGQRIQGKRGDELTDTALLSVLEFVTVFAEQYVVAAQRIVEKLRQVAL